MGDRKQDISELTCVVQMNEDHTTSSFGLGRRTYRKDRFYRMPEVQTRELLASGAAVQVHGDNWPSCIRPEFDQVRVIPKVTRWFTANGVDTHHLVEGEAASVPSNLAAFLEHASYAELAA